MSCVLLVLLLMVLRFYVRDAITNYLIASKYLLKMILVLIVIIVVLAIII